MKCQCNEFYFISIIDQLVQSKQENSELQHAKKEIDTLKEENRFLVQEKGEHIYIFLFRVK